MKTFKITSLHRVSEYPACYIIQISSCFSVENRIICIEVFVEWMDFDKINLSLSLSFLGGRGGGSSATDNIYTILHGEMIIYMYYQKY